MFCGLKLAINGKILKHERMDNSVVLKIAPWCSTTGLNKLLRGRNATRVTLGGMTRFKASHIIFGRRIEAGQRSHSLDGSAKHGGE